MHPVKLLIQQGENVLNSLKDFKQMAKKKGAQRAELYERYCANLHSFNVYTYIDSDLEELAEVQDFQSKSEQISDACKNVTVDHETKLDIKQLEHDYQEILASYEAMAKVLRNRE